MDEFRSEFFISAHFNFCLFCWGMGKDGRIIEKKTAFYEVENGVLRKVRDALQISDKNEITEMTKM